MAVDSQNVANLRTDYPVEPRAEHHEHSARRAGGILLVDADADRGADAFTLRRTTSPQLLKVNYRRLRKEVSEAR